MATQLKDPQSSAAAVLGLLNSVHGKLCLKTLEKYSEVIKKGLDFGQAYKPLVDSSQLDFDTLDIALLPEMMQVRSHDHIYNLMRKFAVIVELYLFLCCFLLIYFKVLVTSLNGE